MAIDLFLSEGGGELGQYFFILIISFIASAARLSNTETHTTIKSVLKGFLMAFFAGVLSRFACNEWIDSKNIAMLIISISAYTAPKLLNALDQLVGKLGSSITKALINKIKDK